METTWLEVAGFAVRSPVTAGTNLLLAIQCGVYFRALRAAPLARDRRWGGFFLMMSVATLAGVLKHGGRHLMTDEALLVVLAISNVGSGVATWFAQRATLETAPLGVWGARTERLVSLQLGAFMVANAIVGPEMLLVIVNTAVGLLPVIAVEAVRAGRVRGAVRISAGLSVSLLTGLVYLLGLSLGRWLNHIDIVHLLMGVSFALIRSGLGAGRAGSVARRGDPSWS